MAQNIVQTLNSFIGQGSPLSGQGAALVRAASKYGVDPRVLAVIAKKESQFGKTSGRFKNNAWGYGVHLDSSKNTFPSWEAGATQVAKELATGPYYKRAGKKTLAQVVNTYAPPSENNTALYTNQVNSWYKQLGGNPNASVFSDSGGFTPTDAGAVPPAASASLSQQSAGQLDVKKLRSLLQAQTKRSLAGVMPGKNFRTELQGLAQQALPRALAVEGAQGVGTAVAGAATATLGAAADRSSAQAINAAKEVLGTPYSWGGGTPKGPTRGFGRGANTVGFDCSSLVQMAWSKAGVSLPRTTYQQIKVGTGIAANNPGAWRPGDLLFPSTGHVQMYLGNGKVIEAPRTGGRVQIVPVRSKYLAVRRPG